VKDLISIEIAALTGRQSRASFVSAECAIKSFTFLLLQVSSFLSSPFFKKFGVSIIVQLGFKAQCFHNRSVVGMFDLLKMFLQRPGLIFIAQGFCNPFFLWG